MSHLDILLERLRQMDEVSLLELLDIETDDLISRFKDVIIKKRDYLYNEVEMLVEDEEDYQGELDGFQIENVYEGDDDYE